MNKFLLLQNELDNKGTITKIKVLDSYGNVLFSEDKDNNKIIRKYDKNSNLIYLKKMKGIITLYEINNKYDDLNFITNMKDSLGNNIHFSRNSYRHNNKTEFIHKTIYADSDMRIKEDSCGNKVVIKVNKSNNITYKKVNDNYEEFLEYDNKDRLIKFRNNRGKTGEYMYTHTGKLMASNVSIGDLKTSTYFNMYEHPILIISNNSEEKRYDYDYDNHGNLIYFKDHFNNIEKRFSYQLIDTERFKKRFINTQKEKLSDGLKELFKKGDVYIHCKSVEELTELWNYCQILRIKHLKYDKEELNFDILARVWGERFNRNCAFKIENEYLVYEDAYEALEKYNRVVDMFGKNLVLPYYYDDYGFKHYYDEKPINNKRDEDYIEVDYGRYNFEVFSAIEMLSR